MEFNIASFIYIYLLMDYLFAVILVDVGILEKPWIKNFPKFFSNDIQTKLWQTLFDAVIGILSRLSLLLLKFNGFFVTTKWFANCVANYAFGEVLFYIIQAH